MASGDRKCSRYKSVLLNKLLVWTHECVIRLGWIENGKQIRVLSVIQ